MRHFMPHPLFLFEARRASKGSVSPAGSVGAKRVPQARSALSWNSANYKYGFNVSIR